MSWSAFGAGRILYVEGDNCIQAYNIKEKEIEWGCAIVNSLKQLKSSGILPKKNGTTLSWFVTTYNPDTNFTKWNFYEGPDLKKQYAFENLQNNVFCRFLNTIILICIFSFFVN